MGAEELIANYGYIAVLIGTFFEGETILLIAGFFAHLGYLKLSYVIAAAFAGSLAGDQLFFYAGRIKGIELVNRLEGVDCLIVEMQADGTLIDHYSKAFQADK